VLAWPRFLRRMLRSAGMGLIMVMFSLALGIVGYRAIVGLSWIDAYENAAMILSGMGPLNAPATTAGKFFAGSYALFSGLVVLIVAGILFTPVVHRLLHRLHADSTP
jgi:hypothetical protein